MRRANVGRHAVSVGGGEEVQAFVPAALPPVPSLRLEGAVRQVLDQALLALGRLDGATRTFPDAHLLLYTYVRKEAVLSSQIEGTQSSLDDLLVHELGEAPGVPMSDVIEVSRYVEAMAHGLQRLRDGFPLSNRLLREMHGILLCEGRGAQKAPGEFRRTQNWIGGTRPGNAMFVPPPPQEVERCMGELERFLHSEVPALVKAALAHVQFETIHPFLDGNGRIGRLLITLLLCHENVLHEPLLYPSLYFKQHRQEYYAELNAVRESGDFERWLEFFANAIRVSAERAVETGRKIFGVFQEDRNRLRSLGRQAPTALLIQEALQAKPLATIAALTKTTGLTTPTVTQAVRELERLGVVRETTGRARGKIFAYRRYLEALNSENTPSGLTIVIENARRPDNLVTLDGMVHAIRDDIEAFRKLLGPILPVAATDEQIVAGALVAEQSEVKLNFQEALLRAEKISDSGGKEDEISSGPEDIEELNRLLLELKDRLDLPLRTYQENLARSAAKATFEALESGRRLVGSVYQPLQSGMFVTMSAYLALITQHSRFRDFVVLVVADRSLLAEQYYERIKTNSPARGRVVFQFTSTNLGNELRRGGAAIGVGTIQALSVGAADALPENTLVIAMGFDLSSQAAGSRLSGTYSISFSNSLGGAISSQAPLIASYSFSQAVRDGYMAPAELVQVRLPGFEQLDSRRIELEDLFPGNDAFPPASAAVHELLPPQVRAVVEHIFEHLIGSGGRVTKALVIVGSIAQLEDFRRVLIEMVASLGETDLAMKGLSVLAVAGHLPVQESMQSLHAFLDQEIGPSILLSVKMWTGVDLSVVDRVYVTCPLPVAELRTLVEKISGFQRRKERTMLIDYAGNSFAHLYH